MSASNIFYNSGRRAVLCVGLAPRFALCLFHPRLAFLLILMLTLDFRFPETDVLVAHAWHPRLLFG